MLRLSTKTGTSKPAGPYILNFMVSDSYCKTALGQNSLLIFHISQKCKRIVINRIMVELSNQLQVLFKNLSHPDTPVKNYGNRFKT